MQELLQDKELTTLKSITTKTSNKATELTIKSESDLVGATDLLSQIKTAGKQLKEKKEGITKPLNESLKKIRELFAPMEGMLTDSEATVKRQMLKFEAECAAEARRREALIQAEVDKGAIKASQMVEEIEKIQTLAPTIEGKRGTIQYRDVKTVQIDNPDLIPRSYMVIDNVAVRRAVLAGVTVPGAKLVIEKQVAGGSL